MESVTESIQSLFEAQKQNHFLVRRTQAKERIQKLRRLRKAIFAHSNELKEAIYQDYRKSQTEVDLSEMYSTLGEIDFAIKKLKKWMKPVRVRNPLLLWGGRSRVYFEPKGVVLIIAPWNYPFSLTLIPLISAIAAGNCIILKPSELTQHTSRFLSQLIGNTFSRKEVAIVEGGPEITQQLLTLPFDHIFFTGSTAVGRIVMEAAAKQLIPVTLELGGKSPVIVDESTDLTQAADRIVWGKFINAGQTCVAPDYVLVQKNSAKPFIEAAKKAIQRSYGLTDQDRKQSKDFCRIITSRHYERLHQLLEKSIREGAQVEIGGETDPKENYIGPTLLSDVKADAPIMKEEIFGPILPILTYDALPDAFRFVTSQSQRPLALYFFSHDAQHMNEMIKSTSAGGTCINATLVHLVNPNLPFGGIQQSGIGSYHGHFGFKAFSHERAVFQQGPLDVLKWLYPPYSRFHRILLKFSIRYLTRLTS